MADFANGLYKFVKGIVLRNLADTQSQEYKVRNGLIPSWHGAIPPVGHSPLQVHTNGTTATAKDGKKYNIIHMGDYVDNVACGVKISSDTMITVNAGRIPLFDDSDEDGYVLLLNMATGTRYVQKLGRTTLYEMVGFDIRATGSGGSFTGSDYGWESFSANGKDLVVYRNGSVSHPIPELTYIRNYGLNSTTEEVSGIVQSQNITMDYNLSPIIGKDYTNVAGLSNQDKTTREFFVSNVLDSGVNYLYIDFSTIGDKSASPPFNVWTVNHAFAAIGDIFTEGSSSPSSTLYSTMRGVPISSNPTWDDELRASVTRGKNGTTAFIAYDTASDIPITSISFRRHTPNLTTFVDSILIHVTGPGGSTPFSIGAFSDQHLFRALTESVFSGYGYFANWKGTGLQAPFLRNVDSNKWVSLTCAETTPGNYRSTLHKFAYNQSNNLVKVGQVSGTTVDLRETQSAYRIVDFIIRS